ncbi:MAG: DUF2202 domain-containing protein [Sulfurimonas sp.]|nr:DUF2202 domain-containing protein [Sulfurimonas sp.]
MNKILLNSILSISTLTLLLSGCGGSDTTAPLNALSATSGQLVDSYLENVDYSCADGKNSVTDVNGSFSCTKLPVTFKLGALSFGEIDSIAPDGQVFPQDLVGVSRSDINNSEVLAMANFMQSCDEDRNSSNGIKISAIIKNRFTAQETFNSLDILSYATDANITLLPETESTEHLVQTTSYVDDVNSVTTLPADITAALLTPNSMIDQETKNTLSFMGNEERLAYDVYNYLYSLYPTLNQLNNIATKSEINHIKSVQLLVKKYISSYTEFTNTDLAELSYKDVAVEDMNAGTYDIQHIQDLYDLLTLEGAVSEEEALKVGCKIEVIDVLDLDEEISLANASNADDVVTVFEYLRDGSYNHYWAFDKGLKNRGIEDGCCSLGVIDGINFCQPEFPQNIQPKI